MRTEENYVTTPWALTQRSPEKFIDSSQKMPPLPQEFVAIANDHPVQAFLNVLPDKGAQFGLLEIPFDYSPYQQSALFALHRLLGAVGTTIGMDQYFRFTTEAESRPRHAVRINDHFRLTATPLRQVNNLHAASLIHSMTSVYAARNTIRQLPISSQIIGQNGNLTDDVRRNGLAHDLWLEASMISGWQPNDIVLCIELTTATGFVPVAGAVIRYGRGNLTIQEAVLGRGESTLPTFQALKGDLTLNASLGNLREEIVANAMRLFSIASLERVLGQSEGIDWEKYDLPNDQSMLIKELGMMGLFTQLGISQFDAFNLDGRTSATHLVYDTHLRGLQSSINTFFGSEPIANAGQMHPSRNVMQTVHAHHYGPLYPKITVDVVYEGTMKQGREKIRDFAASKGITVGDEEWL